MASARGSECSNANATLGEFLNSHSVRRPSVYLTTSDLRASLNGRDVPEDVKGRLLNLHEENVTLKEQVKAGHEKLLKAKAVRVVPLVNCFADHLFGPVHQITRQVVQRGAGV
jgi:hypothetical protein